MRFSSGLVVAFSLLGVFLFVFGCPTAGTEAGRMAACGNGIAEAGEMCEKDADCKDSQLVCSECACKVKESPRPQAQAQSVCGNGKIEKGEECESAAQCAAGESCEKCACAKKEEAAQPACGNGVKEAGEACEKDADCEQGEECGACECKTKPVAQQQPACGNGALDSGEECDVGTLAKPASFACPQGEYCSSCKCYSAAEPVSCKSNHQFVQSTGVNQFIWTTLPACGDDCDYLGVDYKCDLKKCVCVLKDVTSHTCGNNIKESVEECDGVDNSWCKSTQICGQGCTCVNGTRGVCGNDAREGNEQCDGNDEGLCTATQTCAQNCVCLNPAQQSVCGNNVREGTEQCDGSDDDSCASGYSCGVNCVCAWGGGSTGGSQQTCGNGVREGTEQCDGNDRGLCTSSQVCNANCACQAQQQSVCGNNLREGNEQCDGVDRNACSQNQTCNMNCACQNTQQQSVCGNGVREGSEECDGNQSSCASGYYCSQNCACVCPDADADWVCDHIDNCPQDYNPGQGDRDGDGEGDACDAVPVNCPAECAGMGLTSYAQAENNEAACNAKIQQDLQAAMNGLTSENCFTTCKYAETNSTYYAITMNQVGYGCCCLGPTNAWKEKFACTDCPGQNPVCPPAEQVCNQQ